jgi:hypothetical protein
MRSWKEAKVISWGGAEKKETPLITTNPTSDT